MRVRRPREMVAGWHVDMEVNGEGWQAWVEDKEAIGWMDRREAGDATSLIDEFG